MAVSVAVSVRDGRQGGEKRLVFARDRVHVFLEELALYFPELSLQKRGVFTCALHRECLPEIVPEIVSHVVSIQYRLR
jgi:hypothetical protein